MSTKGLMQKGVPPTLPHWILFVKIAILVISLIILALSAYAISLFSGWYSYGYSGAPGFLLFVTIKTFIVFGAITAVEIWAPHFYYRIAALIGYILVVIFWLSAWAWAASVASFWLSYVCSYSSFCDGPFKAEGGSMAACAGLGAVAWILSIVNLVFFIKACLADPEGSAPGAAPGQNQAELGQVYKQDVTVSQQQYPQQQYPQQQQNYGQPAVYQQ